MLRELSLRSIGVASPTISVGNPFSCCVLSVPLLPSSCLAFPVLSGRLSSGPFRKGHYEGTVC